MVKNVLIGISGIITGGIIGYLIKGKSNKKKIDEAEEKITMAYTVYNSVEQVERETNDNLRRIEDENYKKEELQMELWEERNKLEEIIDELKMLKYDAEMREILRNNEINEKGLTKSDISKIMSDAMKIIIKSREELDEDSESDESCTFEILED